MANKIFILLCMIFCHIVDDYYLQGWLASAKQREWWIKNASDKLYKHDYPMALFMHSFSWTFMIMLIPNFKSFLFGGTFYIGIFIANLVIHMFTDNAKANRKSINLVQDQVIHLAQIVITWYLTIAR